ncbi:MAG: 1-deoxy-D-xylulose-5-phosphate synthase [Candidatus Neomarinimicrobiota bacterium]|jgi:1-deoxy-D-xylulose-5-phosphate synthase|nr:1-deoxy-D-xylulose-5-phosphate synthase [Candidatus Neomarinimicrobiota bacterium]MDX9780693.1 1-deoxy-D-xylulose-5-phosphate synthase [bacterium]
MNVSNAKKLLEGISQPADIKKLTQAQLPQLAEELRQYIIDVVSETGGHLAPSLGTVELTIALLYVYDLPDDKIVWDVGHQAYPFKVLTGRREALKSIRRFGGISGFPKRSESPYDVVGVGHASTSISAGLGIAVAESLRNFHNHIIAVIGDGALTGGLAWEGMNNAGNLKKQLLLILNDNEMSISKNVGSIPKYLNRIVTTPFYNKVKDDLWDLTENRKFLRRFLQNIKESLKTLLSRPVMFDELGLRYIGPVNGHSIPDLIRTLKRIKKLNQPILLHILTKKGKGLKAAEENPTKYHGIKGNGCTAKAPCESISYTEVFGKSIIELAKIHPDVVAISAAMADGTGLVDFSRHFPERFYDVGIAEAHAVTFASGLAIGGLRPVVAVYSTFMQRAVDSVIHDVVLQKLPVIFCMDRAGLVGEDGPTHHGVFDLSFLSMLPNAVVCAPKDGNELRNLLHMAYAIRDKAVFIRYPRANTHLLNISEPLDIPLPGSWEILRQGKRIALLAYGSMVESARIVCDGLEANGHHPTLINARFIKPYDAALLDRLKADHELLITIEEAAPRGGLRDTVLQHFQNAGNTPRIHSFSLPDDFVPHGSREELMKEVHLDAAYLLESILDLIK